MPEPIRLCSLEDVKDTGTFNACPSINGKELNLILVRDPSATEPTVRAYRNECPHRMVPLEMFPNEFLDKENPQYLVCSTHGARFQVSDGLCVVGPCTGTNLESVDVTLREGSVFLIQPKA